MLKSLYRPNLDLFPILLPSILLPLFGEWAWKHYMPLFFEEYKEAFMAADIAYIIIVRLALLDVMLFFFGHSGRSLHITLIRIVVLYLEITLVTIFYFALLFYLFDVTQLFHYNGDLASERMAAILDNGLSLAFYISTVVFTSLGLGDWVPQSINAMMAVSVEAILGIVQTGVFMAIVIYAHQNKDKLLPKTEEILVETDVAE